MLYWNVHNTINIKRFEHQETRYINTMYYYYIIIQMCTAYFCNNCILIYHIKVSFMISNSILMFEILGCYTIYSIKGHILLR